MKNDYKIDFERYKLIVDTVFDAADPTIMGSQVTHLLVFTMGVKGASIFVVNQATEELENLASEGMSIDYVNKGPILVDKSIKLAPNRRPVIITDTKNSDQLQYPEKAEKEGVRSIVSLPIKMQGKTIGALRIYHSEPWEVSEQELACLELLARYIGMALRYFRLAEAVQSTKDIMDDIHPIWL
ncbi:MAG: GAF domain-containing protein [Proteobacteria bacterium]|nr:GAF domain-containing protein [Pseudomonadota bacterium]MBU1581464.1 GAF domain-containing protein [Pseudomonadota bacterium]MBU2454327.1 GAF domain-containing protein [Pseudomonadota bacterium]MBU2627329.1 GAF domain-containing protein [Pseudomonadota bacterium]